VLKPKIQDSSLYGGVCEILLEINVRGLSTTIFGRIQVAFLGL